MNFSHENTVTAAPGTKLGIIAPDGRDGMFQHAREFNDASIPFLFDPGQGLPMFSGDELLQFIDQADYMALNDYEAQLTQEKTGLTLDDLATRVKALVVTLGAKGSLIYTDGQRLEIPCVEADDVVDPTGCGDAYRAGLLYGLAKGWSWQQTGQLAAVMGAIKIASRGGQNHKPTREEIAARYQKAFGTKIELS
jgi:adenosine kinase